MRSSCGSSSLERRIPWLVSTPKEPVSSTSAIFTLRHERGSTSAQQQQLPETQTPWPQRAIWSVQIKQPQLQIARSYTPLPPLPTSTLSESADPTSTAAPYNPTAGTGLDEIRLLIRREREGEVSGYLHNLPVGSTVELRGPHIEYEIADDVENIVFLAGGTGIAPALQAAHCIVGKAEDTTHKSVMGKPQIHVLWANRRRDDCLGRDNASSIPEEDDMSARSSGSFLEKLASYFWRSDRPSPASSQTGTPKDLSGHLSQSHSPFPAAASPSSSPPSHRSPSSQNPAPPSQIVQLLQSLQSRFPSQVTASYFVDEEGSYITRDVLARYIARKPSSPPSSSLSLPPSLDDEMKQVDEMKKEQYQMTQKNLEDSMIRWKPANRDSLLEKEKANSSTLRGATVSSLCTLGRRIWISSSIENIDSIDSSIDSSSSDRSNSNAKKIVKVNKASQPRKSYLWEEE
ncbi:MAG: mitochondrial peripheral inner membrane protein [Lichina confinis]|nr:MAG: mitochondrial peripheral inner membrane protein [Lichina confinis]